MAAGPAPADLPRAPERDGFRAVGRAGDDQPRLETRRRAPRLDPRQRPDLALAARPRPDKGLRLPAGTPDRAAHRVPDRVPQVGPQPGPARARHGAPADPRPLSPARRAE